MGEYTAIFGETVDLWFNGTSWQTTEYVKSEPKEVTLGGFTLAEGSSLGTLVLNFATGTLQTAIVEGGNLSAAGGTFGSCALDESALLISVGVIGSANGLTFFPTASFVKEGSHIHIPEGTTIIVGEYTAIFGEAVDLWFNGASWQTIASAIS